MMTAFFSGLACGALAMLAGILALGQWAAARSREFAEAQERAGEAFADAVERRNEP